MSISLVREARDTANWECALQANGPLFHSVNQSAINQSTRSRQWLEELAPPPSADLYNYLHFACSLTILRWEKPCELRRLPILRLGPLETLTHFGEAGSFCRRITSDDAYIALNRRPLYSISTSVRDISSIYY